MRHTFFIFCGSRVLPLARRVAGMMRFKNPDLNDCFHCAATDGDGVRKVEVSPKDNGFHSDERSGFEVKEDGPAALGVAQIFAGAWTGKYVSGEADGINVAVVVPLWDETAVEQGRKMAAAMSELSCGTHIDVLALSPSVASKDASAEDTMEKARQILELIKWWKNVQHIILLSNKNSQGLELHFEECDNLARVLTAYSSLCIENYDKIYPEGEGKGKLITFGLSECYFNKGYFVEYMLHQCYLKLMRRERINESGIDMGSVAKKVAPNFKGSATLLSKFLEDVVQPKIKGDGAVEDILTECAPAVDDAVSSLQEKLESCVGDEDVSLPQKQAMLAITLGCDDELLPTYSFPAEQPIFDDCYKETMNVFIEENNNLPATECDDNGKEIRKGRRVLGDGKGDIENKLPEIKALRADIKRDESFMRQQNSEIEKLLKLPASTVDRDAKIQAVNDTLEKRREEYVLKREKYQEMRGEYLKLVDEIADAGNCRKIMDEAVADQKSVVERLQESVSSLKEECVARVGAEKHRLMLKGIWLVALIVILALANVACWIWVEGWRENSLCWPFIGLLAAVAVITLGLYFYETAGIKKFQNKVQAEVDEKEAVLAKQRLLLKELPVRLQVAGMFMEKLHKTHADLTEKQAKIVECVDRLKQWYKEEKGVYNSYNELVSTEVSKPAIRNNDLDTYMDRKTNTLLDGASLHWYIKSDGLTYQEFQEKVRAKLTSNIEKVIDGFSLYDYLSGKKNYTYLPDLTATFSDRLKSMERGSAVFMQFREDAVVDNGEVLAVSMLVSDENREEWETLCRSSFSKAPEMLETSSPYRLLVFHRVNASLDGIIF